LSGMQHDGTDSDGKPGAILALWAALRRHCGTIKAKSKPGVRFKVRSAEDLVTRIRDKADELGVLIYPSHVYGKGEVVAGGDDPNPRVCTLAEVQLQVTAQAVSDGSRLTFAGFGLGADTQDKAGGKAGTYAFKQALIQALLAGGADDTDDTDTPIPGGPRKPVTRPAAPTREAIETALKEATGEAAYKAAVELLKKAGPETQVALKTVAFEARARCISA